MFRVVYRHWHLVLILNASLVIFANASIWGQDSTIRPVILRNDDAPQRVPRGLVKGSHLKVFLPSLPYLYTSHAINGALIKPSDEPRGWEYDMAVDHQLIDKTTYEFRLRQGVKFQDGTAFNADSVVLNMEYFKKAPVKYSKIDEVFDHCEKIDDYTVRFHLTEEYGSFMNDAMWMQFYSEDYLRLNPGGWNGKANCPNLSMPGPYGLGPYVLTEGYIEGDRHTAKAVLKANPYYWDPEYPKIETVTVYTELDTLDAKRMVLYEEGQLDITLTPPEDKVETIIAPFSKLVITPSTDNIAIHMNMITGNPLLKNLTVRRALNEALHQQNILHFVYEDEGRLSPISPYFPGVREVSNRLLPVSKHHNPYDTKTQARLRTILQGLNLKVVTQDRFLPLWRGIETQLSRVGVNLDINIKKSEKEVFEALLKTNAGENDVDWDLLVWGNDDWYFNHPYSTFLVFRTNNVWSTVSPDPVMNEYVDEMFRIAVDDPAFPDVCSKIMQRAYDRAYMLFVPTPNKVFAINKEVVFHPYKMASIPLWKIEVTDQHWSVRPPGSTYPSSLQEPVRILRVNVR
ncbi:ABC transporter substrate-binding protein [Thalassoroseus pseudoceratinae]|uniref:ABC transporter substrate-binding protein n=1 Tax=Thalassoroseus pseudoceratinae TaxID=2713176 RepID=UPI0014228B1B|nr:ABC transporter substrate-binding protein [Thalassoroseus pseudoceratinae]